MPLSSKVLTCSVHYSPTVFFTYITLSFKMYIPGFVIPTFNVCVFCTNNIDLMLILTCCGFLHRVNVLFLLVFLLFIIFYKESMDCIM